MLTDLNSDAARILGIKMWQFHQEYCFGQGGLNFKQPTPDTIIKPPESSELCEEITDFVVVGDHLSLQGEVDLPPPQTQWSTLTAH